MFPRVNCSKLKLLISAIDDPVDLKSKEHRGHVKIEPDLVKANMQDHKIQIKNQRKRNILCTSSL